MTFNLRFPGQYYDAEASLHYNYFRDYDPQTGRYIESDPIGLEGGINTYTYVVDNPIINIDFFGLLTPNHSCSRDQTNKIIQAEMEIKILKVINTCIKCPTNNPDLIDKIRENIQKNTVECIDSQYINGEAACTRTNFKFNSKNPDDRPEIEASLDGFSGKNGCGCLENTLLHKLLHTSGELDEDDADKAAHKCLRCAKTRQQPFSQE